MKINGAIKSLSDTAFVQMNDGPFRVIELSPRMAGGIRQNAPLVFFNACQSGRTGFSLTRLGSWSGRLVEMGCGGFVGSLWSVTDEAALTFAREFYQAMSEKHLTIGEAMLKARSVVRQQYPDDPTWLAYCCFADPLAKVRAQ